MYHLYFGDRCSGKIIDSNILKRPLIISPTQMCQVSVLLWSHPEISFVISLLWSHVWNLAQFSTPAPFHLGFQLSIATWMMIDLHGICCHLGWGVSGNDLLGMGSPTYFQFWEWEWKIYSQLSETWMWGWCSREGSGTGIPAHPCLGWLFHLLLHLLA